MTRVLVQASDQWKRTDNPKAVYTHVVFNKINLA